MNKHKISVALSGAGGYGYHYLKAFFNLPDGFNAILSSVFDPKLVDLEIYPELIKNGVNCFTEYEDFKNSLKNIDLVVIVSPIHRHGSQTIDALKHGCNVLLDKPLASSLQEAHRIIEARDASKGWVMTGYQWSFSKAIRDLKQDLLDGKLGKVKRAKTMILWPRDYNYYNRNNWAGKKYSHSGEIINDNPVNN
ncbi:MAG: Gfo/Idh/MocA family oxidoreductase, partial [Bacteroidetes bacterium]|nr:Gfo/Idh/MocA family oxidoreductase [Bacteroidota bacterium]